MKRLFAAFVAVAAPACGSPAWTSESSDSLTYFSFDVTPVQGPVDGQCMPNLIVPKADCSVACSALVVYEDQTDQAAGCSDPGTSQPDPQTLAHFANDYRASKQLGPSQPVPVVCAYRQLVGGATSSVAQANACTNATPDYTGASCTTSEQAGWCYAQSPALNSGCPDGLAFGAGGQPAHPLHFECLQTSP